MAPEISTKRITNLIVTIFVVFTYLLLLWGIWTMLRQGFFSGFLSRDLVTVESPIVEQLSVIIFLIVPFLSLVASIVYVMSGAINKVKQLSLPLLLPAFFFMLSIADLLLYFFGCFNNILDESKCGSGSGMLLIFVPIYIVIPLVVLVFCMWLRKRLLSLSESRFEVQNQTQIDQSNEQYTPPLPSSPKS